MQKLFTKLFLFALGVTLSTQSNAQWSNLISENVDAAAVPALPTGFTSYPTAEVAFMSDSTNYSDCVGASGLNNIVIRNSLSATGDYILYFPSFATLGKDSVHVSWNSRVSSHFLDLGSSINNFEFSTNGTDWTALPYVENAANSAWSPVNMGSQINLPVAAMNKASVQLRLNIHIENNVDGTYRLDDITVTAFHLDSGNSIYSLNKENSISVYPNPSSGKFSFHIANKGTIEIFNTIGRNVMLLNCKAGVTEVNVSEFSSGLYLIHFTDAISGKIYSEKILLN